MREHAATRLLSEEDRIAGFIKATGGFAGSARRWKERAAKGMTDAELAEALAFELGIAGGSGGPDSLSLWFQGAGLRIWISWEIRNTRQTKPTFQGCPFFNGAAISGSSEMLLALGVSANLGVAALAAFAIYGAAKTLRSLRVLTPGDSHDVRFISLSSQELPRQISS